jgi:hypothetical protein
LSNIAIEQRQHRLRFILEISGGLLRRLLFQKVDRGGKAAAERPLDAVGFKGPYQIVQIDEPPILPPLGPDPAADELGGALYQWLAALSRITLPRPGHELPFGIRLARAMSTEELDEFIAARGIAISKELEQFWSLSNGMSFLGWEICGTYDSEVFSGRNMMRISGDLGGGDFLGIETQAAAAAARPFDPVHWHSSNPSERRSWPTLRAFFDQMLDEAKIIMTK